MLSECDDFQCAFSGKHDDEDNIDPIQDNFFFFALLICLYHHGHHVETDQHHDEDIKKLFGNQVKDQTLELVLVRSRRNRCDVCLLVFIQISHSLT